MTTEIMQLNSKCILRIKDAQALLRLSRSSIYAKINKSSTYYDSTFPKPVKLSARSIGWLASELNEWIAMRIKDRDGANSTKKHYPHNTRTPRVKRLELTDEPVTVDCFPRTLL